MNTMLFILKAKIALILVNIRAWLTVRDKVPILL
jgi:hypothetical protein